MTCWISSSTRTAGSSGARASARSPPSWPPCGPFWGQQGFPDAFLDETLTIDTCRQHAVFTPWTAPGQSVTFDTDPERVVVQTADGQTIASRTSPRSSYAGRDLDSPWDALQVGYFLIYGMWNYLTTPFLLTYPAVKAREISPWQEDGQTWRRLHATFPATRSG